MGELRWLVLHHCNCTDVADTAEGCPTRCVTHNKDATGPPVWNPRGPMTPGHKCGPRPCRPNLRAIA